MKLPVINYPSICAVLVFICSFSLNAETDFFFEHANAQTPFSSMQASFETHIANSNSLEQRVEASISLACLYLQFDRVELLTELLEEMATIGVNQSDDINALKWQLLKGYSFYSASQYVVAKTTFLKAQAILDVLNSRTEQGHQPQVLYLSTVLSMYSGINDAYLQHYTKATEELSEVNKVANENNWPVLSGLSLYFSGDVNYELKNYEQAQVFYELSKQTFTEKTTIFRAISLMSEAQMVNIVGDRKHAFFLLDNAIRVFAKIEDISSLAYAYLLKSYFHSKDGNDKEALSWIAESVTLREELNNPVAIANSYVHYSSILQVNGFLERALVYGEKAANLAAQTDDLAGQWDAYNQYGQILNAQGNFKKAFEYMSKSERALLAKARLD
ncbi:hypothetical protein AB6T38_16845, partial [Aliiglaciecola sp. SL4]|uniref:hypothetical protein n=1 Tax=Aliiglaciecola sp. SL4 TaxID=3239806 RepID=UPI00355C0970